MVAPDGLSDDEYVKWIINVLPDVFQVRRLARAAGSVLLSTP